MAKLKTPAKKIDQVRNVWPEIEKLRRVRFTLKQIAAELPEHGIKVSYPRFVAICRQICKEAPGQPVSQSKPDKHASPLETARKMRAEKSKPIFEKIDRKVD